MPTADAISGLAVPATSRRRVRGVIVRVAIAVCAGGGLYGVSPWLLPPVVREGPLIQQTTESSAIVVAYLTRGTDCELELTLPDGTSATRKIAMERDGTRLRAALDGLSAGQSVPYRIRAGERLLFEGVLRTSKARGADFRFLVFGDSGRATREQFALARQMARCAPDLLVHTGDLVYPEGKRSDYEDKFFRPYRELLSEIPLWPTLGNHDDSKEERGDPYREVFELPANGPRGVTAENNYWFEYGEARFVVLDSNATSDKLAQLVAPWARAVLGEPGPTWRFVVFHHPPYTAGQHKPHMAIREALVPIFEETGVDIVLCGHDHLYERSLPLRGGAPVGAGERGVLYVVSGAGGASLYKIQGTPEEQARFAKLDNAHYSLTQIDVSRTRVAGRQISAEGDVLDEWVVEKPRAAPAP